MPGDIGRDPEKAGPARDAGWVPVYFGTTPDVGPKITHNIA
jgi:hypothetical protein